MHSKKKSEKPKKIVKTLYCLFFAFTVLFTTVFANATFASTVVEKKSVARDIAIVFDNSGSMYPGKKTWCQATYAIEVFASMLNDGDKLSVYPMNDIEVDGKTYTSDKPLVINSTKEASKIRRIFTPAAKDTPIEPIFSAFDDLKKSKADEKWIIVTTDGAEFYENEQEMNPQKTTERLSEVLSDCNKEVNVIYLGIGKNLQVPEINGKNKHGGMAVEPEEVTVSLSSICNMIFGRDVLPDKFVNTGSLKFDIPLSKLILFVQGENVEGIKLSGKNPDSSCNPMYSELGAAKGFSGKFQVDTTLQGQIATFKNLEAGEYKYEYAGDAKSFVAYYEPDVDLAVDLIDKDGNKVEDFSVIYPGKYTISTYIADKTGKPVTSELLGNTEYKLTVFNNNDVVEDKNGINHEIELKDGEILGIEAMVTFLNGYSITKTNAELGWPEGGIVVSQKPIGKLELKVSSNQSVYKLSEFEDLAKYHIDVLYDGMKLTGSDLDRVKVYDTLEGKSDIGYVFTQESDGFLLSLKHMEEPYKTPAGVYTVSLAGKYEIEEGLMATSQPVEFDFELLAEIFTARIENQQSYIQLSKIDEAKPLRINLEADGEPISDEKLKTVNIDLDADGLEFEQSIVPGESAIELKLVKKDYDTGVHAIKATAKSPLYGESNKTDTSLELQKWPKLIKFLIIAAIILLIALLILFIMTRKILPAKVFTKPEDCEFRSNHHQVQVYGNMVNKKFNIFNRFSEQYIQIRSPQDGDGANTSTITVRLKPCTKVFDVLFNKSQARVEAYIRSPGDSVKSVNIEDASFSYSKEKNTFVDDNDTVCASRAVRLRNGSSVEIDESVPLFGGKRSLNYLAKLRMKW